MWLITCDKWRALRLVGYYLNRCGSLACDKDGYWAHHFGRVCTAFCIEPNTSSKRLRSSEYIHNSMTMLESALFFFFFWREVNESLTVPISGCARWLVQDGSPTRAHHVTNSAARRQWQMARVPALAVGTGVTFLTERERETESERRVKTRLKEF